LWYYLRFFALVILAPDLAAAFLAAALPLALYEYDFPFTIGIVYLRFLAVLAACVKFFEVGAPLLPRLTHLLARTLFDTLTLSVDVCV
jgi:hypothetical protein